MPIGIDTYAYRRDLPHLRNEGKTYFVTFCTHNRAVLSPQERDLALASCIHDHQRKYWLHCAVVMPDHVHLLITPYPDIALAKVLQAMKGASAHAIRRGRVWQHESFDRAIRRDEDLMRKAEYICQNPVRAGLVACVEQYRWVWRSWVDGAPARAPAPH